nr:hypothetical protein [Tanacetum cinerariifolium]
MQTQTSNALHNVIMEAGSKDRPPMLALARWCRWWWRGVVLVAVVEVDTGVEWQRRWVVVAVAARGVGDRIDRLMGVLFGFAEKSPPEKFSGGGGVVAGWPDSWEREMKLAVGQRRRRRVTVVVDRILWVSAVGDAVCGDEDDVAVVIAAAVAAGWCGE